jgi:acyl dehydratase
MDEFRARIGAESVTDWITVDKVMNDVFCHLARDFQPIYTDSRWCAEHSPFGAPIVHPSLLLAMEVWFIRPLGFPSETTEYSTAFHYGFNYVEWRQPVRVGEPLRACVTVRAVEERQPGEYLMTHTVAVEVRRGREPAVEYESCGLFLPPENAGRRAVLPGGTR